MSDPCTALRVTSVSKHYGEQCIYDSISFTARTGEFIAILGPSGSGKTSLLRSIAGLGAYSSGTIEFPNTRDHVSAVSFVFQDSPLFPWLTVYDNLRICLPLRQRSRSEQKKTITAVLLSLGLQDFMRYYPHQLSGGMVQRVNIARAFLSDADIMLMDEPFGHVDFFQRQALQQLLIELCAQYHKTVLFVTHNMYEAVSLADRILVLSARPGRIIKDLSVPIPRPRNIETVRDLPLFRDSISELRALLHAEFARSQTQEIVWLKEHAAHSKN